MAQNRGFYAGVALVGAGAYYFYRAGGDPQTVGEEIKCMYSKPQCLPGIR